MFGPLNYIDHGHNWFLSGKFWNDCRKYDELKNNVADNFSFWLNDKEMIIQYYHIFNLLSLM